MGIKIINLEIRQEFDRLKVLHLGHYLLLCMSILLEFLSKEAFLYSLAKLVVLSLVYKFYYKTVKNLYYSFWTFSFFILGYFVLGMYCAIAYYENLSLFYTYLMALIFLVTEMFILFSPIYYPIVRWWEYDFRFRDDLKVKVAIGDEEVAARLTDLRRNAGCIVLFKELKVGERLHVIYNENDEKVRFEVELMSRFYYSIGRPIKYGVSFKFKDSDEEEQFKHFSKFWKIERKYKGNLKFKELG